MKKIYAFMLAMALPLMGQEIPDEEDLFGEDDFDSLFGEEDILTVEDPGEQDIDPSLNFLVNESTQVGGDFSMSLSAGIPLLEGLSEEDVFTSADLVTDLYIDARPDRNFRFLLKARLDYPFETTAQGNTIADDNPATDDDISVQLSDYLSLQEAFTDVTIMDGLFLRSGKQVLSWGVGYFFSPADLVSLASIDPSDPEAYREGPVAVNLLMSQSTSNLSISALVDPMFQGEYPIIAPKVDFVVGSIEATLGAVYEHENSPAAMISLTGPLWDLDLFGETVLRYGSKGKLLEYEGALLTANKVEDQFYVEATAGLSFFSTDDFGLFNVNFSGQYLFNSQGYEDPDILQDVLVGALVATGQLEATDLIRAGQHYGAASLAWTGLLDTDFSLSAFGIHNFTDGSGQVRTTLSYSPFDYLRLELGVSSPWGEDNREFTILPDGSGRRDPEMSFGITMGMGEF